MSTAVAELTTETNEAVEFHRFLGEQLQKGVKLKSPEKALAAWRQQRPIPAELVESVAEIQQALDDISRGDRGRPSEEVTAEIRQRLGLAARS